MTTYIKPLQHRGSKRNHTQLDMKNVLPTSFTWPDIDEATALMYEPNELQIRTKATKRMKRPNLDTHSASYHLEFPCSPMEPDRTPARALIQHAETTPRRYDTDMLMEPVELPFCSTPPEVHTIFAQPLSEQSGTLSRLKSVATLGTVEPYVKRTKVPLHASAKRKCIVDRKIGYAEVPWTSRIESARSQHVCPGCWYRAWMMKWPASLSERLGICTSKGLLPLWQQTVEVHVCTLDRYYRTLMEHTREIWAQRQVDTLMETTSQVEDPWPDGQYSSEVGRGQDPDQNEFDLLPWTSLGQAYMDWPEDAREQSFSSANTSIVQQASRWKLPRLPRMSSEPLHVKSAVNTSIGSLPWWPTDTEDSMTSHAKGFDGTNRD